MSEGRFIQARLPKTASRKPQDKTRIFANLIMEGQIKSAMRFVGKDGNHGVLSLTEEIVNQLRQKHPEAQEATLGSFLLGPIEEIPDTIFCKINGEMVREAALRTKGSGGPSGIDAVGVRRMVTCKLFKTASVKLCDALALLTRKLCTQYVGPVSIEGLVECVIQITKPDILDATGSLQVSAGQKSGSEAAVHAMNSLFSADETDAVLLTDATNAFNTLNRAAALHNISILCPTIATFVINTYRLPVRLFVKGGQELKSSEGMTQGDPLSMSIYGISLIPLMLALQNTSNIKQCWLGDDASGAESIKDVLKWWQSLEKMGPLFGYQPNALKCWLIVKPNKYEEAMEAFQNTGINVTTEGRRHLGAALGSRDFLEDYVNEKAEQWVEEVIKVSEFANSQPQACFAAYTFGSKHRWTYFMRTLPDIQDLLRPLEDALVSSFIPSSTVILPNVNCQNYQQELED